MWAFLYLHQKWWFILLNSDKALCKIYKSSLNHFPWIENRRFCLISPFLFHGSRKLSLYFYIFMLDFAQFIHLQAIQDVDVLLFVCFIGTDLDKCSITSLAHQLILCSEWVPSEWEFKQLIKTFLMFNYRCDVFSVLWGSIGEQGM